MDYEQMALDLANRHGSGASLNVEHELLTLEYERLNGHVLHETMINAISAARGMAPTQVMEVLSHEYWGRMLAERLGPRLPVDEQCRKPVQHARTFGDVTSKKSPGR